MTSAKLIPRYTGISCAGRYFNTARQVFYDFVFLRTYLLLVVNISIYMPRRVNSAPRRLIPLHVSAS